MSSTGSREAKARIELDKAYQRLLENSKYLEELLKLLNDVVDTAVLANDIHAMTYDGNAKELAQKYIKTKANGEVTNVSEFIEKKKDIELKNMKINVAGIGASVVYKNKQL
ncbi:hypothetical protein CBLAS_0799 [Campylobacter blaseri]|uniref:Uncharacterized protein n=1 Tax=Campylobacter blaseri TaxID=2042961 RepID=A0A2P8R2F6_9BACT|nr:hypothetical protein [Campylobacter blaseri]PSM52685.1 hypothetical protein CQ405_02850 [Campylobacter blaseri]PSM54333.1 hypothetical protein CRN67_02850 [Campylobacter blaseri]QKF85986.1 hypothetical protein CBLAS_0799 [Campylobacter blaseri]